MRHKIKKFGNSAVIVFTKEILELYNLKVGDVVEIKDSEIRKVKRKKK